MAESGESRNDFTSEIYKLELRNLPKFGFGELKKFLRTKLQLNPVKIKAANKNHTKDLAYICFRNEIDKRAASQKLNGYVWKGKTITAGPAKAIIDPMQRKKNESSLKSTDTKTKTCLEATVPLWLIPYDQQLIQKEIDIFDILKSYGNEVQKNNKNVFDRIENSKIQNNGLPCAWLGYKASPQIVGYRNKSEFTVGKNSSGIKTVGFRIGSYIEGSIVVESVENLPHIPDKMKLSAKLFEKYVQSSSFDVFNPELYTGQFRQLSVRYSHETDEVMLIVGIHTMDIKDKLKELKEDILKYFTEGEGQSLKLSSLYIEEINKREPGQTANPLDHIFGVTYITAIIHGLKFKISPTAFFQINTAGAEVLYQNIIDICSPLSDTTILDICCGTGSIGLCLAKYCRNVLGVELNAEAIKDATINAAENNITNCKFFAGNCDDYITSLIHTAKEESDQFLAVIDPPRAGLHNRSISALRNAKGLNKLIYISCSPKSAMKNWIDLARPQSKIYKGEPFVAVSSAGVDMFPHTNHKELIILFERIQ